MNAIKSLRVKRLDAILSILGSPEKSMDGLYGSIFERITRQSESDVEIARHVFMWMTYALRPVELEEVVTAFTVDYKTASIDASRTPPNPQDLLLVCGNLVIVDNVTASHKSILKLVHTSVKDYVRGRAMSPYVPVRDLT